jgi:drug/metabolite transporter (DMT)-like permease
MGTALGYLAIKEAQKYYDSRWVVVSFMGAGLIASSISLLTGTIGGFENSFVTGVWVQPSVADWIWALVMGLLALGVQYFTTQALLNEKASIVGVVGNSAVIFSIAIEVVLGHGLPDLLTFLGMGLIVWAGWKISR